MHITHPPLVSTSSSYSFLKVKETQGLIQNKNYQDISDEKFLPPIVSALQDKS